MSLNIIIALLGSLLALFIPGYLLTLIFFKELNLLQKIALAITFSIMIDVAIGIFLGYNENMKNITGGVTSENVWFYSLIVTGFLVVVYLFTKTGKQILPKKSQNEY